VCYIIIPVFEKRFFREIQRVGFDFQFHPILFADTDVTE
jgi:hypothetical protein